MNKLNRNWYLPVRDNKIEHLSQKFNEAAEAVKALTKRPNDEELLELYGLFKQATVGDNNTCKLLPLPQI